jgi:hypothetical protein
VLYFLYKSVSYHYDLKYKGKEYTNGQDIALVLILSDMFNDISSWKMFE